MIKTTRDIQRRLDILDALEAGGVHNWDGYDFSLEELRKKIEKEEAAVRVLDDIMEVLCLGITEPAGRGCGYGFSKDAQDDCLSILLRYGKS